MKARYSLHVLQTGINPCTVPWDSMDSRPQGAYCSQCKKTVHDLSGLSRKDYEEFIRNHQGEKICCRIPGIMLDKPVSFLEIIPLEERMRFHYAVALFLLFGATLFSCNEKEHAQAVQIIQREVLQNGMERFDEPDFSNFNSSVIQEETKPEIKASTTTAFEAPDPEIPEVLKDSSESGDELPEYILTANGSTTMLGSICVISKSIDITDAHFQEKEINSEITHEDLQLMAFPNPARSQLNIKFAIDTSGFALLSLFAINGEKITDMLNTAHAEPGTYTISFEVSDLPAGMYLLVLINEEIKRTFKLQVVH